MKVVLCELRAQAARVVGELRPRGAVPILVGGPGFYLRALRDGVAPLPATDPALREFTARLRTGPRWSRVEHLSAEAVPCQAPADFRTS